MTEYDIHSEDPMEMIWAVRERIYEETKNMTREEYKVFLERHSESFKKKMENVRNDREKSVAM